MATLRSLEICSGSGRWTKGLEKEGCNGTKHDILISASHDLRSDAYVHGIVHGDDGYDVAHCGVCCTTCSRKANPPYRSKDSILHLEDLAPKKLEKAKDANAMAVNAAKIMATLADNGTLCSIENPGESLLWEFYKQTGWEQTLMNKGFRYYVTVHCHYGTRYRKRTRFLANYCMRAIEHKCRHKKHAEVLCGQKKYRGRWVARTLLANPYPHRLVLAWVKIIKTALRFKGQI